MVESRERDLVALFHHHSGHFLLASRSSGKNNKKHLQSLKGIVGALKEIAENPEMMKILIVLELKLELIVPEAEIDLSLLNQIQKLSKNIL